MIGFHPHCQFTRRRQTRPCRVAPGSRYAIPAGIMAGAHNGWIAAFLPLLLAGLTFSSLAFFSMVFSGNALGEEKDKLSDLQEKQIKIEQLDRERSEVKQRLTQFDSSKSELRSEIRRLSDLVRESKQRKDELQRTLGRQKGLIIRQEKELALTRDKIRSGENRIRLSLRRLYRLLKTGREATLFQLANSQTFAKDAHYMTLLREADQKALDQYQALTRELLDKNHEVELSLVRLKGLQKELEEETANLYQRESFLEDSLKDVEENRAMFRSYLADLDKLMSGMEEEISRLESEAFIKKEPQGKVTPETMLGALKPPVAGKIIARFGDQDPRYDLKKFQRGIVLRVNKNASVSAVAGGKAVHAGAFRGYQSLVVLDHGNGLFTVYGHLENLGVKRGEWVDSGERLGQAAYQPLDQAYDVYFEIRHNGKPDDPLRWIKPELWPGKAQPSRNGNALGG